MGISRLGGASLLGTLEDSNARGMRFLLRKMHTTPPPCVLGSFSSRPMAKEAKEGQVLGERRVSTEEGGTTTQG